MAEVPTPDRVAEENETAAVADKQSEGKTPQLEDQSDTVTGQQDDDTSKARATAATSSKKKKKKDKPVDKKVEDAKKAEDAASIAMSNVKNLQELITKLSSMQSETDGPSKGHEFWDTQPVPKLDETVDDVGPVEPDKSEIREDPYSLPDKFKWDSLNLDDDKQLTELHQLLYENYVEDEDNMFRFNYSKEFLRWALQPPHYKLSWYCGIRVIGSNKLVGFISGVPAVVSVKGQVKTMAEINFLCVHKKLRSKRMAPVLIREITRRVNLENIFQALYTAGVKLPTPIASCRYWHRNINPKKLVDIQFSHIPRNMTMQRMIKLYRIPQATKIIGLRRLEVRDIPDAYQLMKEYLSKFELTPIFSNEEEFAHWFLPRPEIISCFVVEDPVTHKITDLISYYNLPSTIVRHPVHKQLKAAYAFYNVPGKHSLLDLMSDALVLAKEENFDVFNALDLMENKSFLEELKFGMGDGHLHYYLYNFKCPELPPDKVGVVLQ
ncbi:glycylpeptide N-tetradecanoyltransferase 2-like [Dysidea avara]|uniref:glycylpeptide N-tetradecanoyltransferase 2-like n=1 Tax=Dysidea avara TaxID=196820 RepID=UPI00331DF462